MNPDYRRTIGVDVSYKEIVRNEKALRVGVWDTVGQENHHRSIGYGYYKRGDGILLVYDVTREESYQNIRVWVNNITEHARPKVPYILIGNKIDLADPSNMIDGR